MNKKLLILFLCVPGFQPFINAVDLNQILQRQGVDKGAPVLSVSDDNSIVNRALKSLWVGSEYTLEQKTALRKKIADLQAQNLRIERQIGLATDEDTVAGLKDVIKSNEEQIYQMKVTIGDAWSPARKTFVLATVAALGFGVFKYLQPVVVMNAVNASQLNGDNSDNTISAMQPSENVFAQSSVADELSVHPSSEPGEVDDFSDFQVDPEYTNNKETWRG